MIRRKSRFARQSRSARFESLEQRTMMAGDVSVSLTNGSLLISGDVAANGLEIAGLAAGEIRVTGLDAGGTATTINGVATQTFTGVTGSVVINLGDGNDLVNVHTLFLAGHLVVNAGAGNDTVALAINAGNVVSTARELVINGDAGNDVIKLHDVYIGTSAIITGGDGADQVHAGRGADNSERQFSCVADLAINLGQGYGDMISLNRSTIGRYFRADAAEAVDLRYSSARNVAAVFSGTTDLAVDVEGSFFGSDLIVTSATELGLSISGAIVTNNCYISSSGAINGLSVASSIIDTLSLIGMGESDRGISIANSILDQLMAHLGDGDNDITLLGNSVREQALLNVGARGRLSDSGNSFAGGGSWRPI